MRRAFVLKWHTRFSEGQPGLTNVLKNMLKFQAYVSENWFNLITKAGCVQL